MISDLTKRGLKVGTFLGNTRCVVCNSKIVVQFKIIVEI